MSVTSFANATQTAVIGTEHFVANVNQAGIYILEVDTVNMVAGDALELRAYRITLSGGTVRLSEIMTYYGAQEIPHKRCFPISNDHADAQALRFSIKQTFGTGRNFPWKVLKHA